MIKFVTLTLAAQWCVIDLLCSDMV